MSSRNVTRSSVRRAAASATVVLLVTGMGVMAGGGTASAAVGKPVPIASGLSNPRQMAFGPSGALYVALAGSGRLHAVHVGGCATDPEGGVSCVGDTGGVERIGSPSTAAAGAGKRVQWGLFSIADKGAGSADPPGSAAVGLDAISFAPDGTEWGIITPAPPAALNHMPTWVQREAGHLVRISNGVVFPVANIAAYSLAHPNAGHSPDTDPYGVLAFNDRVYVADAANDRIYMVKNGVITTIHVFPHRTGDGSNGSFDTVPTSLATDGTHLFVGTLGSFIPGKAKVYEMTMSGHVTRTISGLSQVTSVAVTSSRVVYATEIFGGQQAPFDSHGAPNGRLVRIRPDGEHSSIAVPLPGGVATRGGHVYVSVFSIAVGAGAVWRLQ
jgi:hypothetical protein